VRVGARPGGRGDLAAIDGRVVVLDGIETIRAELAGGRLRRWDELADRAPGATFFQRPLWATCWYEAYANEWDALVLVALSGDDVIGLAPLGRHRPSGRLAFAGELMADYRDLVVAPEARETAVVLLTRALLDLSGGDFVIGPTDVGSVTIDTLTRRPRGWWGHLRTDPCWRVELSAESVASIEGKQSVRRNRAHYRRRGALRYERVRGETEWRRLRPVFFEQHTLRQLAVGRAPSFHDVRKQRLYDTLLARGPDSVHVSALWVDGRCLAAHYGYSSGGTVYWGAPALDVTEDHGSRSPGQLLLAELVAAARAEGYRELDLTLGEEAFKVRFGTKCVQVGQVRLYGARTRYWAARGHRLAIETVKAAITRAVSDSAWARLRRVFHPEPPLPTLAREPEGGARIEVRRTAFVEPGVPEDPQAAPQRHENQLGDLVRVGDPVVMGPAVRTALDRIGDAWTLHTLVREGRLQSYGWSWAREGRIDLRDLAAAPGEGSDAVVALVGLVASQAFARGAGLVSIGLDGPDGWLPARLRELGFTVRV
jgi:CelD/BcsL family acetyltransferase involved in cellulose biosynthesis